MDINTWLTVITVFMAVFTLLPKDDLFLSFQSTSKFLRILFVIINIFIIPYLLYFEKIVQRFSCLEYFTVFWGFDSENIAFALFYISFIWLLFLLFINKPKPKADKEFIEFFIRLLNEKPFEEFFKLFTKYTRDKYISDDWKKYKQLIFQPNFLNKLIERKPTYLLQFWGKFNSEDDFQSIFRMFLLNSNSVYYSEIKGHGNSYSLLDDKPFLDTVIKENIKQSIHNGILMIFTDHVSWYLQSLYGKEVIYNQKHYTPRIREDEGFDLPIYYHIRFIGLMYSSAIENGIDISTISHKYTNMQTIYSNMMEQMINNIIVVEDNANIEYSSNYHWMIREVFDLQSNWLILFSDKNYKEQRYFDENSSYISFIPFSMSLCLSELYKGLSKRKITIEFLNEIIYYSIFSHYFSSGLNDIMKSSIENKIIKEIPKVYIKSILGYALDTKYAISINDFINNDFRLTNGIEKIILQRLLKFLRGNDMM